MMKIKLVTSSCLYDAELVFSDGSVRHILRRSFSELEDYINTYFDYSTIVDYVIKGSSYYSIVPEVN